MTTWVQADVDRLKVAISSGVLTVRFDGPPARLVTYQNLAEMRALLAEMVGQVNQTAGKHSYRLASVRKGV